MLILNYPNKELWQTQNVFSFLLRWREFLFLLSGECTWYQISHFQIKDEVLPEPEPETWANPSQIKELLGPGGHSGSKEQKDKEKKCATDDEEVEERKTRSGLFNFFLRGIF